MRTLFTIDYSRFTSHDSRLTTHDHKLLHSALTIKKPYAPILSMDVEKAGNLASQQSFFFAPKGGCFHFAESVTGRYSEGKRIFRMHYSL
jgi:hypothetical protein